jgi:putative ABC transport system permease protein
VLYALKKTIIGHLAARQALKGLFRPGNATRSIIVTLTASLAVIFSIYLIERNLDASFVQSYPPEAPNLFFLDIQPSQKDAFSRTLNMPTEYYPIVRARITSINGEKIDREQERQRRGDNLARTFNLTYRDYLLEDEVMLKGGSLFRDDIEGIQVSLLDTVQKIRPLGIGDLITFRVQGVPLQATVSSIRSRTEESIRPYFYFVFPPDQLKDAPQTIFTGLKVEKTEISQLQNAVVERFPNVSVIDLSETVLLFARVLKKLTGIIRFFMSFSIAAGILIIISSLMATRFARIREAVYFKILGAKASFVIKVFALENLVIGLLSAVVALTLSQTGSLIISKTVLNISYKPFWGSVAVMTAATIALVYLVGLMSSITILRKRPVAFLREQTDE